MLNALDFGRRGTRGSGTRGLTRNPSKNIHRMVCLGAPEYYSQYGQHSAIDQVYGLIHPAGLQSECSTGTRDSTGLNVPCGVLGHL
jgi:hypothetical protein